MLQKLNDLREIEKRIKDELEATDTQALRAKLMSFSLDFRRHYQTLLEGRTATDLQNKDIHGGLSHTYSYTVAKHGKYYKDEMEMVALYKDCPWLMSYDQLTGPEGLDREDEFWMDQRLLGVASYRRSLQVMEFMMFHRNFSHLTDEDILNKALSGGHHTGRVDPNKLVSDLANLEILGLSRGVRWYLSFLETLFASYGHPVVAYMTDVAAREYNVVGDMHTFIQQLQKRLTDTIHDRLHRVKGQWDLDLSKYTTYSPIDMISRMLVSMVAFPLDNLIPDQSAITATSPEFTSDASPKVDEKRPYVHSVDKPRNNTTLPPRPQQVLQAYHYLAKVTRTAHKVFNTADLVKGGFVSVKQQEHEMLDFDYIRSCAFGFYIRLCFILTESLRATIYTEFIKFMTDPSELENAFHSPVADYDEAALEAMIHTNPDQLKETLNSTQREIHAAEQVHFEMSRLQSTVQSGSTR
jgi:hypothetical protein